MPITGDDIDTRFSVPTASAGGELAQGTPGASLGKYISSSVWLGGALHDLFSAVTGDQNVAQQAEYRCIFILNKHATLTLQSVVGWFTTLSDEASLFAVGADPTVASQLDNTTPQALMVVDRFTPPASVIFSTPILKVSGVAVGDIPPGFCRAIWLRRTAVNGIAVDAADCVFHVEGDTEA
jgi:hypothetical protein